MTVEEVLKIKRLLEGNFLKVKEMDDNLFIAIMGEYDYQLMVEASKNYIKTNKFPPTIAVLIDEYHKVNTYHKTQVVREMQASGVFKSMSEFQKALTFVERDLIPDWFRGMLVDFVNQHKISTNKQLLLGTF